MFVQFLVYLIKSFLFYTVDVWDGPDNTPKITHGNTLCTNVKLIYVVKTIKEHAFVTTELVFNYFDVINH